MAPSTQQPRLERAGEFAPAEEDPSRFPQRCEALTIFSKHKRHRKSHGRLRPTGYPSRALCHCVKHVVAATLPRHLGLASGALRKAAEDLGRADAERYQQFPNERGVAHASGSPFVDCRRGPAGHQAERTASELAMTRLVASPRREVLCPVRHPSRRLALPVVCTRPLFAIVFALSRLEAAAGRCVGNRAGECGINQNLGKVAAWDCWIFRTSTRAPPPRRCLDAEISTTCQLGPKFSRAVAASAVLRPVRDPETAVSARR